MKFRSLFAGVFALAIVLQSFVAADKHHTFVGPTLRGVTAAKFGDSAAYSFLAEIAPRNFRFDVTGGYQIGCKHFVKVTGDFLTQKLQFPRTIDTHRRWVRQEAVGLEYSYDWNCGILNTLDFNAYYSRAHDKNYSDDSFRDLVVVEEPIAQAPITQAGIITEKRAISGARAYGFAWGASLDPFQGTTIFGSVNYDNVKYRTKNANYPGTKAGVGGTFGIKQQFLNNLTLEFRGQWRRPFNDYYGAINYHGCGCGPCDQFIVGVFGGYTDSKYGVPSVSNAGIQLAYIFGGSCCYDPCEIDPCCEPYHQLNLVEWVAVPAVYMPVVLATRDTIDLVELIPAPVITPGFAPAAAPAESGETAAETTGETAVESGETAPGDN